MKNNALPFKWRQKMALIGSTDLIVCFGHFGSMFWTNLGPIYAKMAKYDCEKASFYNLQAKTCIKRIKLSEIVDFCLFYIRRPNSGPICPNMTLSSQFLKFSCKIYIQSMKLFERVDLWYFLYPFDHFGPILDQFWVSFGLLMG